MKKNLIILSSALLFAAFSFCSCGNAPKQAEETKTECCETKDKDACCEKKDSCKQVHADSTKCSGKHEHSDSTKCAEKHEGEKKDCKK
jgi:hypothetical protein